MRTRVLGAFAAGLLLAFLLVQVQRLADRAPSPADPELPPPPTPLAEVAAHLLRHLREIALATAL